MESCADATLAVGHPRATRSTYVLVGAPNVGKSVVFHRLTGTYANVSNYPGTTVEVARAPLRFERGATLLDTPGVLAFPSRSADERAAMCALLGENPRALVQVADAKHLRRSLAITLTLAETGLPLVLALNMSDEAAARGVQLDLPALAQKLGIDVVATVATLGEGVGRLVESMPAARIPRIHADYPTAVEAAIARAARRIAARLDRLPFAARGLAILFLARDPEVEHWLGARDPELARDLAAQRATPRRRVASALRRRSPARVPRRQGRSRAASSSSRPGRRSRVPPSSDASRCTGSGACPSCWPCSTRRISSSACSAPARWST